MNAPLPRRSFLGAVVTAVAARAALAATGEADPVHAAIAAAVEAEAAFSAALAGLDEDDDAAMGRANAACDRSTDAFAALGTVIPTTTAGLHALIRHYAEDCRRQDAYSVGAVCLDHLARCIGPDAGGLVAVNAGANSALAVGLGTGGLAT